MLIVWTSLTSFSGPLLLTVLERRGERIEPALPQRAILADPRVQLVERLGPQRIETPRPIRPHADEPGLLQNAEMPRHPRLVDVQLRHEVVDGLLAAQQRLDDLEPAGVGESLNGG